MAMLLLTALGIALVLTTTTETLISGNYRDGSEALYAADAGVERVMEDLLTVPDWNDILSGASRPRSSTVRRAARARCPTGPRSISRRPPTWRTAASTSCGDLIARLTDDRPWGTNNPRWQLYAYGPLEDIVPTDTVNSHDYVIVWVADDPSENDGDPLHDGAPDGTATMIRPAPPIRARRHRDAGAGVRPDGAQVIESRWRAPTRRNSNAATPASAARTSRTAARARRPCRRRARR